MIAAAIKRGETSLDAAPEMRNADLRKELEAANEKIKAFENTERQLRDRIVHLEEKLKVAQETTDVEGPSVKRKLDNGVDSESGLVTRESQEQPPSSPVPEVNVPTISEESTQKEAATRTVHQVTPLKRHALSDTSAITDDPETNEEDAPPVWIQQGVKLRACVTQKGFATECEATSNPIRQDDEWVVTVEWTDQKGWTSTVPCSNCSPMEEDESSECCEMSIGSRPRKARRVKFVGEAAMKPEEAKSARPVTRSNNNERIRRSRAAPDAFQFSRHSLHAPSPLDTNSRATENDDKKPAARRNHENDKAARDSAIASLQVFPNNHSLERIHRALDQVGYPYRISEVMLEIQTQLEHDEMVARFNTRNAERESFKITKDLQIRRYCNQGISYDGWVVDETPREEIIDGKWVQDAYHIIYDVGTTDILTEAEVRMYRFPKPEMQSFIGRKFQFLELFSGTYNSLDD